ncbi:MAG: methyltransferase [Myxococcaceae bacterium]|nr:methyltransferase [Myxococcaceae bacterium]
MSDGPVKMAPPDGPDAPALDDIILGEDDQTMPLANAPVRGPAAPPTTKDTDALARAIESGAPGGSSAHSANSSSGASSPPPAPEDRPSQRSRSSNRVKSADPVKDTRKRQKMTLRIPDDEVSRPQLPATTPMGGVPAVSASRPPSRPDYPDDAMAAPPPVVHAPLQSSRIISVGSSVGSADDTLQLPAADLEARGGRRAPGIDAAQEAGWTPYQPTVADRSTSDGRADFGGERIMTRGQDAAAAAAKAAMREPLHTMIDEPGMGAMASMLLDARAEEERAREETPSVPPVSEDIPIDTDDDEPLQHDRSDELVTRPRLPAVHDSEEIRIDEGERRTDPGEVADEIGAEDLVSVESIPSPHSPHAPPLLRGSGVKHAVTPTPAAVTATALMAGVSPIAAGSTPHISSPLAGGGASIGRDGVTPIAPAVAARMPSTPAPAPASSGPGASATPISASIAEEDDGGAYTAPAAGTPMARRQQPAGGPFGFEGSAGASSAAGASVGGLAPPAMNESAAHRKKIRPWWEDLFNDDFIRTMAKITDADIAREANFIEESLGCEAGATILDLACGTGRHAVELASRGYQVVGFDLSLAMLARASDEAQDRKQKINFVQGDMREMTFEETFDGVFSWNTSFGYFEDEKNAAVIAKVHRSLKKGGQFLLDVVNRDCVIRQAPSLAWFEGDGCICMDEMQIDFITSRMKVKRTLMMEDGRTKEIEYSIRIYSLHELGKMLHDNGFRVAEVSGGTGTPGVFFGCEAPRTLILAEKR